MFIEVGIGVWLLGICYVGIIVVYGWLIFGFEE